jgi:hypothetical protein
MEIFQDIRFLLTDAPHAVSFILFVITSLYLCLRRA